MELPITKKQTELAAGWLKKNYADAITDALKKSGLPFNINHVIAIICQETAYVWVNWVHEYSPEQILGRCVFDASGDLNGTRQAFPKDTEHFIEKYGQDFADFLINEANLTRKMRGWKPKRWVYCGYGIAQYDLQNILTDEIFFRDRLWYSMEGVMSRLIKELSTKIKASNGDIWDAIRRYNGSGKAAENYKENVKQFYDWITE